MADPLRHRQTKGAATDMVDLTPPRHIPTLPTLRFQHFLANGRPRRLSDNQANWPRPQGLPFNSDFHRPTLRLQITPSAASVAKYLPVRRVSIASPLAPATHIRFREFA
jgi:hypothetical protein